MDCRKVNERKSHHNVSILFFLTNESKWFEINVVYLPISPTFPQIDFLYWIPSSKLLYAPQIFVSADHTRITGTYLTQLGKAFDAKEVIPVCWFLLFFFLLDLHGECNSWNKISFIELVFLTGISWRWLLVSPPVKSCCWIPAGH